MKGFKDAKIYVEGKGIIKTSLSVENGKIASIGEVVKDYYELPDDAVVVPGFIDEHIHGSAGSDAMDASSEALKNIATSIACEGTVGFLATTMTQSREKIMNAMNAVKEYKSAAVEEGAEVLGVHLEGPFINKSKAGAQPEEYICTPSVEIFKEFNEASGNNIKIVTFAPETQNGNDFVTYLSQNGICAQMGHTSATFDIANKAYEDGATGVTHTYNAQSAFTHREAGVVGAALLIDGLYTELICDTIHVSVPAIKLLVKNKPLDRLILITDAMRAKNLGDTISELGGQTVYVKNGEARLKDGTLAGSVLKMNDAIKNLVTKCGVPFTQAVDYATANPSKNLGIYDRLGSIKVGKDASFAIISEKDYSVIATIKNGKLIYSAK